MLRFGWLRLAVRFGGTLLVIVSLPRISEAMAPVMYESAHVIRLNLVHFLWTLTPPLVQLSLGLYCLFGGGWIVHHCVRDIDTICPSCANDIRAVAADTCPRCSFRFRAGVEEHAAKDSAA